MRKHQKKITRWQPSASHIDKLAVEYETAADRLEHLRKELMIVCRMFGFTPKDAPKTKLLAGELWEILASRASRTDVDQNKAQELKLWMQARKCDVAFSGLFHARLVFDVLDGAARFIASGGMPRGVRERFERCLLKHSSRRLTVRRKKSQPAAAKRKAA